jgi:hypothetical protein
MGDLIDIINLFLACACMVVEGLGCVFVYVISVCLWPAVPVYSA